MTAADIRDVRRLRALAHAYRRLADISKDDARVAVLLGLADGAADKADRLEATEAPTLWPRRPARDQAGGAHACNS